MTIAGSKQHGEGDHGEIVFVRSEARPPIPLESHQRRRKLEDQDRIGGAAGSHGVVRPETTFRVSSQHRAQTVSRAHRFTRQSSRCWLVEYLCFINVWVASYFYLE